MRAPGLALFSVEHSFHTGVLAQIILPFEAECGRGKPVARRESIDC